MIDWPLIRCSQSRTYRGYQKRKISLALAWFHRPKEQNRSATRSSLRWPQQIHKSIPNKIKSNYFVFICACKFVCRKTLTNLLVVAVKNPNKKIAAKGPATTPKARLPTVTITSWCRQKKESPMARIPIIPLIVRVISSCCFSFEAWNCGNWNKRSSQTTAEREWMPDVNVLKPRKHLMTRLFFFGRIRALTRELQPSNWPWEAREDREVAEVDLSHNWLWVHWDSQWIHSPQDHSSTHWNK